MDSKPAKIPIAVNTKLEFSTSPQFWDVTFFWRTVGALQYLTLTRPDLSYAINKVCQFMHNRTEDHWVAVKCIQWYLRGTHRHGLHLIRDSLMTLQGFTDSDWAGSFEDRKSTTGCTVFVGHNLIFWSLAKQKTVARSSSKSDCKALVDCAVEIVWLKSLLFEL